MLQGENYTVLEELRRGLVIAEAALRAQHRRDAHQVYAAGCPDCLEMRRAVDALSRAGLDPQEVAGAEGRGGR